MVHWATHWDRPWSRCSTGAGVVVPKTGPNPITVQIESSHPLSLPGIARSSNCPQVVQCHTPSHLGYLQAHRGGRGVKLEDRAHARAPTAITRARAQ